jgi:hypothetical protein
MRNRAIQLLTLVLCLSLAAAQACACRTTAGAPRSAAGAHACCPSDSAPSPADPCEGCRIDVAAPKSVDSTPASDFAPVFTSAIENHSLALVAARMAYLVADDVPIPPLLRDLHHLDTQLIE